MVKRLLFVGCSLIALSGIGRAETFRDLKAETVGLSDSQALKVFQGSALVLKNPELRSLVTEAKGSTSSGNPSMRRLRAEVSLRSSFEKNAPKNADDQAKQLSSSFAYNSNDEKSSNWVQKAFSRFHLNLPEFSSPRRSIGSGRAIASIANYILWTVLALALIAFLTFATIAFSRLGKQRRVARALLDESDPELTGSEWLESGDALLAQAKYREAVRAFYLASLIKIDDLGISRFIRSETNWNHLFRYDKSIHRPTGLDFRPQTQLFDQIWYGKQKATESVALEVRKFFTDLEAYGSANLTGVQRP